MMLTVAAIGIAAVLLNYLLHSTLVAGAAWLIARPFSRRSDLRETVWKAALIVPLVTAPLQFAVDHAGNVSPSASADSGLIPAGPVDRAGLRNALAATLHLPLSATAAGAIAGIWLFGATIAFARQRRAAGRLQRRIRTDAIPCDPGIICLVRELGDRMGVQHSLGAIAVAGGGSPFVIGPRTIVMPADIWTTLDADERQAILAHEVAHIARGDVTWRRLLLVVGSVAWFQPLTRLVRRRITECAELLSDRAAVRHTGKQQALASSLLALAEHLVSRPNITSQHAAVAASGASVVQRVDEILRGACPVTPRFWRRGALGALLASGAIALFCTPSVGMLRQSGDDKPIDPSEWNTYLVHTHVDARDSISTQFASMGLHEWRQFDPAAHAVSPVHIILDSRNRSERRRLEMVPGQPAGQQVRFEVNGVAAPYDEAARRWLAQRLADLRS